MVHLRDLLRLKDKYELLNDQLRMKFIDLCVNFQVQIRPMMYIALTYDHRLIDGREAVLFLRKIKAGVEDPRVILAGV